MLLLTYVVSLNNGSVYNGVLIVQFKRSSISPLINNVFCTEQNVQNSQLAGRTGTWGIFFSNKFWMIWNQRSMGQFQLQPL